MAAELDTLVVDREFHVVIPSRFPPIQLYARIARGRDEEVANLESLTNPRLKERGHLIAGGSDIDAASDRLQNWNHAPFAYHNPEGTRFFEKDRPALELTDCIRTALAISVRKRETFLGRTRETAMGLDMRVITRRVTGRFADGPTMDTDLSQEERRSYGLRIALSGLDGLLFRLPGLPSATCVSVLNGGTLGRAVQGEHFRFMWDGTRVTELYSFSRGVSLAPEQLTAC
ncbi:MAG: hypothetical protein ACRYG8_14855 [Janthinobacterium lividum]